MAYIKPDGSYYEGDRQHSLDAEVPQRPSPTATWDGQRWVLNIALDHNAPIDAQIAALEAASGGYVRGVREMFLGQAALMKQARAVIDAAPSDSPLKALAGCFLDFTVTPGMQKIKQLDDQIKALRATRVTG